MKNEKINILVTGIGGDIGIGIIKVLRQIQQHSVIIGCDIDEYPASKGEVNFFYKAPRASNHIGYLKFLLKVCENHSIDLIIPSTEQEIKVLNCNRDEFTDKGIKLLINDSEIIETFMDKMTTISFFEKNGIEHPMTIAVNEFKNHLDFPFLMKNRFSQGSKGVFLIEDNNDYQYYKRKNPDSIIQEIIGDSENEFTIGLFSDGKTYHNIAFRRMLGYEGLSKFVTLVRDPKIDDLVTKLAKALNFRGNINIQARKNNEGNYIPFEINPRLSSTLAFRHHFGFEDLKWWINLMFGTEDEILYKLKYLEGVGIKALNEVFLDLKENKNEQ